MFWDWKEKILSQAILEHESTLFYVKIRSSDSYGASHPCLTFSRIKSIFQDDNDLNQTYCFDCYGDVSHAVVVSKSRGRDIRTILDASALKATLPNTVDGLCMALQPAATSAIFIAANGFPHGDVLPHNLVFDGSEFHLIDVDEVTEEQENPIPRRGVTYHDEDFKWLTALEYPNLLREKAVLYTRVQLVSSLLSLSNALSLWEDACLDDAKELAKECGAWLAKRDVPGNVLRVDDTSYLAKTEELCRAVVSGLILQES